MFTNIPLIINLGESGPLTWDMAKQIISEIGNIHQGKRRFCETHHGNERCDW